MGSPRSEAGGVGKCGLVDTGLAHTLSRLTLALFSIPDSLVVLYVTVINEVEALLHLHK